MKFEFDCFFSIHVCYNFLYFIGAANIAVFWYTIVWLKLISYVSVNLWYRLGLMKHEKEGETNAWALEIWLSQCSTGLPLDLQK